MTRAKATRRAKLLGGHHERKYQADFMVKPKAKKQAHSGISNSLPEHDPRGLAYLVNTGTKTFPRLQAPLSK